jgi:cellulose synthase operon protein C
LVLLAENKPEQEVFRQVLGWDEKTLDTQYAAYLDARLKTLATRLDFQRLQAQAAAGEPPDETELTAILKKNPDDFFANLELGVRLCEAKSYAAAETSLKKAESLFPQFVQKGNPYELLGDMYLAQGRDTDALAQFNAWAGYDETTAVPLTRAAQICRKRKDWAGVARLLELSVYIDPYEAKVHGQLGDAAVDAANWPAAIAAYQVALGLNPPDPAGAHYSLAMAFFGAGKPADAKLETLRALEIAPTFEKAQQLLLKLNERK